MEKNKPIKGTVYLQGEQSHFDSAIAKALNVDIKKYRLSFDICIDILESLKNEKLIYRVDYVERLE